MPKFAIILLSVYFIGFVIYVISDQNAAYETRYENYTMICKDRGMIPIYESRLGEYVCVSGSFIEKRK